jgi:hypothetical protein
VFLQSTYEDAITEHCPYAVNISVQLMTFKGIIMSMFPVEPIMKRKKSKAVLMKAQKVVKY